MKALIITNPGDKFTLVPYAVTPNFQRWASRLSELGVSVFGESLEWIQTYGHKVGFGLLLTDLQKVRAHSNMDMPSHGVITRRHLLLLFTVSTKASIRGLPHKHGAGKNDLYLHLTMLMISAGCQTPAAWCHSAISTVAAVVVVMQGILHRGMNSLDKPSVIETINPKIPVPAGYYCETVHELLGAYKKLGTQDAVVKPVFGAAGNAICLRYCVNAACRKLCAGGGEVTLTFSGINEGTRG